MRFLTTYFDLTCFNSEEMLANERTTTTAKQRRESPDNLQCRDGYNWSALAVAASDQTDRYDSADGKSFFEISSFNIAGGHWYWLDNKIQLIFAHLQYELAIFHRYIVNCLSTLQINANSKSQIFLFLSGASACTRAQKLKKKKTHFVFAPCNIILRIFLIICNWKNDSILHMTESRRMHLHFMCNARARACAHETPVDNSNHRLLLVYVAIRPIMHGVN